MTTQLPLTHIQEATLCDLAQQATWATASEMDVWWSELQALLRRGFVERSPKKQSCHSRLPVRWRITEAGRKAIEAITSDVDWVEE